MSKIITMSIEQLQTDRMAVAAAVLKALTVAAIKEMNPATNLLGEINNVIVDEYMDGKEGAGFDDLWTDYLPKIQAILDGPGMSTTLKGVDLSTIIAALPVQASQPEPSPEGETAVLTYRLVASTGYECDGQQHNISPEHWGRICAAIANVSAPKQEGGAV